MKLPKPTPATLLRMREAAGLTQQQAAELVGLSSFKRWLEHESGARPIDPARFELFTIKLGLHPAYRPARGVAVPKAPA